jgi:hypothetical protein
VRFVPGRPARILLLLTVVLLALPSTAHAYLDPGTGSYVLQLLLGTVLGGLLALGVFWRRVVAFFKHLFTRGSIDDGTRR